MEILAFDSRAISTELNSIGQAVAGANKGIVQNSRILWF